MRAQSSLDLNLLPWTGSDFEMLLQLSRSGAGKFTHCHVQKLDASTRWRIKLVTLRKTARG